MNNLNFETGQVFIANYGAMIPIQEGKLIGKNENFLTIEWDTEEVENVLIDDISTKKSLNGSPIGIFPLEVWMNL